MIKQAIETAPVGTFVVASMIGGEEGILSGILYFVEQKAAELAAGATVGGLVGTIWLAKKGLAPNIGLFRVGKHGEMPSPRAGQRSHHGAMSAWMKQHFPGYDPNKAPAILMPDANHRATFGVFNTWRAEMKAKMGGVFDWSNVSQAEMTALSEKMFDAAGVPADIRREYWAWFDRMIGALK